MKKKILMGLIATATIGTAIGTPVIMSSQNTTQSVNKLLMVNNTNNSITNEAVVINGNSNINLYALSTGKGLVSNLSVGEMLTIIGNQQGTYCKVKVQETGAVGYINVSNMQNILNGTNDSFTKLSESGQVINVSSNVRIRSNPSIGNNIIGHLTNGTNLNILGKQGQWYKVSVNGQIGFIYEEYVNTNVVNKSNQSLIISNVNRQINDTISNSNINTNSTTFSNNNSTKKTNSNSHVKNIIVRTKSNKQSSSHINNSKQITNNTNKNNVTQINKTVKIYIPGIGSEGIGMTAKPLANNYSYYIPKGISTVRVISENSYDELSYIEYNGHYGYVSTSLLKVCENDYFHMNTFKNINNSKQITNNTNKNNVTQINKTVKIYIPGTGSEGIGMTAKPLANNYSYYIPKGISTVHVISENSYDELSYIEYNGHYGYVSTSLLKVCENDYLHMNTFKNINNKNVK